jgi:cytosine/adenosine deaminase-related metal-dependent hydrolase
MNLFKTLQVPEVQRYWIRQARVPICFLSGRPKTAVDPDGATLIDLLVDNERIAAIEPAGVAASADLPAIDLEAHHVWPTLIDMHAHLDKGHIVIRTENPDGSFAAALKSIAEDRSHRWTAKDIQRRVEFGLRCAYIHGVAAIRTHLEDIDPLLDTLLRLASERGLDVDLHVDESGDPAATALAHVAAAVLRNGNIASPIQCSSIQASVDIGP